MKLFEHNESAYVSAMALMDEVGKAAIVHPTGTGKSFIGFKLCEDEPDKAVCWLSPSEYIFKTQTENWLKAGGKPLGNLTFFTYAKLMLLSEGELSKIQPDYIILDEFHRCGAEMWGAGVARLLKTYPSAKLLGLSATSVRYLDNQRDMSDELFDGNVASEMTLGEAIVRGILNSPKYVLSVYSYQKELTRYATKAKTAKSLEVRAAAEKYLESLRKALENADGLDKVFEKHMQDRHGKYILFCSDYEHMQEMIGKVPEWFKGVDEQPHVYEAYSDDPTTERAFAQFKRDESEHLKLLFCIDMLNEGVHIDDVSGVVLFRPTVSPIIYKQQIGRALSASKSKEPVIFDIVNNIENLYSIGAIEDEMQAAVSYYRERGLEKKIVNERFEIVDEVQDCKELFERLNDTLSASWEMMYARAAEYYKAHGNLEVPKRYKTEGGYSLGAWLQTQRKVRAGETFGRLTDRQIERLDSIGMVWGSVRDIAWERNYAEAKRYREKYGDLDANIEYRTETGFALGRWLSQLRTYKKSGVQSGYLTEERVEALNKLGMVWSVPDYVWERNFAAAMDYYREHGDLEVPAKYVSKDGVKLGSWIRNIRKNGKMTGAGLRLSEMQVARLDEIGMKWENTFSRQWERGFEAAKRYFESHGDLNVPTMYLTSDGFKLGDWISNQRENGKLTEERRRRLDEIGMIWKKADSWEVRFGLAKEFYLEHGNLNVPANYIVHGVWLNKWVNEQKQIYLGKRRGKVLTSEQIERLEAVGMVWK